MPNKVYVRAKQEGQKPTGEWARVGEVFEIDEHLVSKRWHELVDEKTALAALAEDFDPLEDAMVNPFIAIKPASKPSGEKPLSDDEAAAVRKAKAEAKAKEKAEAKAKEAQEAEQAKAQAEEKAKQEAIAKAKAAQEAADKA